MLLKQGSIARRAGRTAVSVGACQPPRPPGTPYNRPARPGILRNAKPRTAPSPGARNGLAGANVALQQSAAAGAPCIELNLELNTRLRDAGSVEEVLALVAAHHPDFNLVNACTAHHCLAKLSRPLPPASKRAVAADPRASLSGTQLLRFRREWSMRTVQTAVWGHAMVGLAHGQLLHEAATYLVERPGEFSPESLAWTLWSFAAAGYRQPHLLEQLPQVLSAERCAAMDAAQLSRCAWALARLQAGAVAPLDALAAAALAQLGSATPRALTSLLWSFAALNRCPQPLFDAAAGVLLRRVDQLNAVDLCNAAKAFAHAFTSWLPADGALHDARGARAAQLAALLSEVPARGALLRALARRGVALAGGLDVRGVTALAAAYASVELHDARLFDALAERAVVLMRDVDALAVATLAWAFARVRHEDRRLFAALAVAGARQLAARRSDWNAKLVSMAVSGYAHAYAVHDDACRGFVAALAARADEVLPEFTSQGLSNTAWGLVVCGCMHTRLLSRMQLRVADIAAQMGRNELIQMHQVVVAVQLEAPAAAAASSSGAVNSASTFLTGLMDMGLLRAAAGRHFRGAKRAAKGQAISVLHRQVAETARELGVSCEVEYDELPVASIDVALVEQLVAIEVDGPSHFMHNSGSPTGATRLKRRLLARMGWRPVSVPHHHWDQLHTPAVRRLYLWWALQQAGVTLHGSLAADCSAAEGLLVAALLGPRRQQGAAAEARGQAAEAPEQAAEARGQDAGAGGQDAGSTPAREARASSSAAQGSSLVGSAARQAAEEPAGDGASPGESLEAGGGQGAGAPAQGDTAASVAARARRLALVKYQRGAMTRRGLVLDEVARRAK